MNSSERVRSHVKRTGNGNGRFSSSVPAESSPPRSSCSSETRNPGQTHRRKLRCERLLGSDDSRASFRTNFSVHDDASDLEGSFPHRPSVIRETPSTTSPEVSLIFADGGVARAKRSLERENESGKCGRARGNTVRLVSHRMKATSTSPPCTAIGDQPLTFARALNSWRVGKKVTSESLESAS